MFRQSLLLRRTRQPVETAKHDARSVVLLADANSAEAGIRRSLMEKRNLRVVEASEGSSALELAIHEPADLVIAALDLPQGGPGDAAELEARLVTVLRASDRIRDAAPSPPTSGDASNRWQPPARPDPVVAVDPPPPAPPPVREQSPSADTRPRELEIDKVLAEYPRGSAPPIPQPAEPPRPPGSNAPHDPRHDTSLEDLEREKLQPRYPSRLAIAEETAALYRQALVFLTVAFTRSEVDERLDFGRAMEVARRIVESLELSDRLLILATERTAQYQLSEHCVNVAIFATRVARTLDMTVEATVRVALAALLHDIGTVRLTRGILQKSSVFTTAERSLLERRPFESAQILSNVPGFAWLPEVVLQVHERDDGSGYPRKLRGREICEEAKVIGVADSFDGLLHHRPHRRAGTGYRALEVLTAQGAQYTNRIIKALLSGVTVYPYNEHVVLNTREIAKVVGIHRNPLRPLVRVIYSADAGYLQTPKVIDLVSISSLWITRAITREELPAEP